MPIYIQPSFARGELSPSLYGRVDTSIYGIGLRTARNVIIEAGGGVSNRAGTIFKGPAALHNADPRLIPFQFNTTDKYMLEFGELYMRVLRGGAYVLEASKSITAATAANPVVITSASHGFSSGEEVSIFDVLGMVELNSRRYLVANPTANTFELTDQVTGANVDGSAFTAYTSGGSVAKVFQLTTPYAVADVMLLKYQQTADVMTLTHNGYETRELTRTGHTSWTLSVPEFVPSAAFPTAVAITVNSAGTTTYRYRVTAVAENPFEESLPGVAAAKTITGITQANPAVVTSAAHGYSNGDEIHIDSIVGMTELNGRRFTIANVAANTFELEGEDSTAYTAYSSGGSAYATFAITTLAHATVIDNTISWVSTGAGKYTVYREKNGLFGFLGETEGSSFKDTNIDPDLSISPPKFRNPFFGDGNYAGAVGYYEQRRALGGSINAPDTTHYSQTGNPSNYTTSSPQQADDAITASLASGEVNEIRHYVPGTDLLIMTSGSEWRVNSGQDVGFAADTLRQKPQSFWGVSHHRPAIAGDVVLFITENNSSLRSLGYSLEKDRYLGVDLGIVSDHLLEGRTIVDAAFSTSPAPRQYLVLDDGTMLTVTYNPSQDMVAWTRWDTLGKFTRVAVLRNEASSTEDAIYVVTKRFVNGNWVRYIECVSSRIFEIPEDCFFVDSGLSLDSPVDITGITAANPVVVTAPSHGFSNGDEVDLSDIIFLPQFDSVFSETQPDQLNGRRYTVASSTANTFALSGVDGTAHVAYVEGGKARKAVSEIRGLHHLAGESVVVLADGNVISSHTVDSTGKLTPDLTRKASRVHIGKRFISDLETLDVESPNGTIQSVKTKVTRVTLRMKKTRGLFVGPRFDKLREMKFRENEAMGAPTALKTGDKTITLDASWASNGRVCVRQMFPLPMTILAAIPNLDIGGG